MEQDKIFEQDEGNNWFSRNKDYIINKKDNDDIILKIIKKLNANISINSILELGCSNGYRLNNLKAIYPNAKIVGTDISNDAVIDGKERYGLELYQSSISNFTYHNQFDLVIVNFVYDWVDRENIFKAISNTDNLIKDGGLLILGDFLPNNPQKRIYHHRPKENIYTYKLNYAKCFTSLNTYKILYNTVFNVNDINNKFIEPIESSNRGCCTVLKKDLYNYYIEG